MSGKITDKELSDGLTKKINDLHDFLTKGGNIANGALDISTNTIRTNKKWIDFHDGKTGIYSPAEHRIGFNAAGKQVDLMTDSNMPRFEPFHNNEYHLGSENFKWKDIWLSNADRTINGYTKLPNGLIMQWGEVVFELESNGNIVTSDNNFPVVFPNKVLNISINCNFNRTAVSLAWTDSIETRASSSGNSRFMWCASHRGTTLPSKQTFSALYLVLGY